MTIFKRYRYVDSHKFKDLYFDLLYKLVNYVQNRNSPYLKDMLMQEHKKLENFIKIKEEQTRLK